MTGRRSTVSWTRPLSSLILVTLARVSGAWRSASTLGHWPLVLALSPGLLLHLPLPVLPLRMRVSLPVLPGDLPGPVHVPSLLGLLLLLSLILLIEVSLLEVMLRQVSTMESWSRRIWLVLEKMKWSVKDRLLNESTLQETLLSKLTIHYFRICVGAIVWWIHFRTDCSYLLISSKEL